MADGANEKTSGLARYVAEFAARSATGSASQHATGPASRPATESAPESTIFYANGLAGWLMARWHRRSRAVPRLAVLERINLAPRQSLALIEAEGRRILVATSPEGGPAFYPLDDNLSRRAHAGAHCALHGRPRVSW